MRGSEVRPDILPAAGVHNLDNIMLTNSLSATRVGQCQYPPVRGGGRRGPGGSGRLAPGPLPAPHRAPQLGPQFPQLLRSGAVPHQRHQDSAGISRNSLRSTRTSCRLTQLCCWVVPGLDSSSSAGSVRRVPFLHSAVSLRLVLTCLLFLKEQQAAAAPRD